MENKFYPNLSTADTGEIIETIDLSQDAFIQIDEDDIHTTLKDAANALLLEGRSSGQGRIDKALEEIELLSHLFVGNRLFTAKRILMSIEFDPKEELIIDETNAVCGFITKFNSDVDMIWGVARCSLDGTDSIRLKMLITDIG